MPNEDRPALLTVADVAARFGVSTSTVRVWLSHRDAGATGGVPSILPEPLARGVVWLADDIEAVAAQIEGRSRTGGRPKSVVVEMETEAEPETAAPPAETESPAT
ncbi:helix-turn-helix transcriptional regulator [Leifsonia flava]|uniref:helix-turn-helix transcriptional regulator n=1 Tax=Orlajensenia leifsoniae TaxID=2561933 RepID=UPI00142F80E8|nr:helix-turn-helix domain-containing protein [Leifsonia flava]